MYGINRGAGDAGGLSGTRYIASFSRSEVIPMTSPSVPDIAKALMVLASRSRRILITGPRDVDGDSLGACLALARVLEDRTDAELVIAAEVGWRYVDLPWAERCLLDHEIQGPFDLAVVLDGDRRRLSEGIAPLFLEATHQAVIDHHRSTTGQGYDVALVDDSAASTAELVHALLDCWQVRIDADLARCLLTGVAFDTGGFRHNNTTPQTLRLAADLVEAGAAYSPVVVRTACERRKAGLLLLGHALHHAEFHVDDRLVVAVVRRAKLAEVGARLGDLDFIVDQLLYVQGVEVAVLAVERGSDQQPELKLSLRSRGGADVCSIAAALHPGGGGHERAAGAVLDGPADRVLAERVLPLVRQELAAVAAGR
jgi:bifunctional oligoribonuclease and PAP phosphatase NrnA